MLFAIPLHDSTIERFMDRFSDHGTKLAISTRAIHKIFPSIAEYHFFETIRRDIELEIRPVLVPIGSDTFWKATAVVLIANRKLLKLKTKDEDTARFLEAKECVQRQMGVATQPGWYEALEFDDFADAVEFSRIIARCGSRKLREWCDLD